MLVDFTLNTGLQADTRQLNIEGSQYAGNISVGETGALVRLSSLNSQTLFETTPTVIPAGFDPIIENSGDYYLTGSEVVLTNLTGLVSNVFLYDMTQTGSGDYAFGDSGVMHSGFMDMLGSDLSGHNFHPLVFVNGQKAYSGIDYTSVDGDYSWLGAYSESGKLFYYRLQEDTKELYGTGQFDLSGVLYNQYSVSVYVNGMEQRDCWLEVGGITPINTGESYQITGHYQSSTTEYIF